MKHYTIAGGDDGCYGPRFGPVAAEEIGLFGAEGRVCLLLRLLEPIQDGPVQVQHLAVRPRYEGVTFHDLQASGGTVGVSVVFPGQEASVQEGLSELNSRYWAIGTCTPSDA
jgi:hypothetical protein